MDLYIWFLQKTSGKKNQPPYPLPRAIAKLVGATGFENNLIVCPGYLSTKQNTTKYFFDEFDKLMRPGNKSYIGFLRGMNGANLNPFLDNHKNELKNQNHMFEYGPEFDLTHSSKDHRKMVFFYSVVEERAIKNYFAQLETGDVPKLKKQEALDFTRFIQVNAVAIGSSNFSKATYFGQFDKGEADVILFANDPDTKASDFSSIVKGFSKSEEEQISLVEEFPESVLAKSICQTGNSPHEYLKQILVNTIKETM